MNTKKNNNTNEYVQVMMKVNIQKNNDKIWLQECTR